MALTKRTDSIDFGTSFVVDNVTFWFQNDLKNNYILYGESTGSSHDQYCTRIELSNYPLENFSELVQLFHLAFGSSDLASARAQLEKHGLSLKINWASKDIIKEKLYEIEFKLKELEETEAERIERLIVRLRGEVKRLEKELKRKTGAFEQGLPVVRRDVLLYSACEDKDDTTNVNKNSSSSTTNVNKNEEKDKPRYYHIRTPDLSGSGEIYQYDLNGYCYQTFFPVHFTWVGDLTGLQLASNKEHTEQKTIQLSQYIGSDHRLYLKFGPIAPPLTFSLDYRSGPKGEMLPHTDAHDFSVRTTFENVTL